MACPLCCAGLAIDRDMESPPYPKLFKWDMESPPYPKILLTNGQSNSNVSSRLPYLTWQPPQLASLSSLHNIHLPLGLEIVQSLLNMYICSMFIQLHVHLSNVFCDSFISHTLDDREHIYLMHFALCQARHQVLIIFNKCIWLWYIQMSF